MASQLIIRDLTATETGPLGELLVRVYAGLDGFPTPAEQPAYYDMLLNIGRFAEKPETRVLVALTSDGALAGGVVYFGDMASYGSGGSATQVKNASGIHLLGVDPSLRNMGVGKALTKACIDLARDRGHSQVILHTTQPMKIAWGLYERLGFRRSDDLDFSQQGLQVFGFRLTLAGA